MTEEASRPQSTSHRVWQLAWPTIISNLLFTTVGFLHIKIASPLGTNAVAAVTTGHRVFFLIQAIMMGVSVATTALVARYWGANKQRRAEMVTWTSLALAVALGLVLGIPPIVIPETIAGLFRLDPETSALAARFIFWLGLFNLFPAINMVLSTALRATGDVITPLWFLIFSSIFNVIFGYLLAFGHGFLPAMGVAGISLGGSSAATLVTLFFLAFWWRGRFKLRAVKRAKINLPIARQIWSIGLPSVLEQGFVQIAFLAFFAIVAQYGTTAYAAYGIGISLVSFSVVIGFGFGLAAATLVGQQLGAGNPELAIQAGWRGMRLALAAMVLFSVLMVLYAEDLASFMISDPEAIHLTSVFIYFIAVCQPLMAIEISLAGALRGAGDTRFPLLATIGGMVFGRLLPALIYLKLDLSIYWILSVMVSDYAIKAALLLHRYRSHRWVRWTLSDN